MARVEVCSLAPVPRVGHKGDVVLEVVGAVVKHRVVEGENDHLQGVPRLSPALATWLHLASESLRTGWIMQGNEDGPTF